MTRTEAAQVLRFWRVNSSFREFGKAVLDKAIEALEQPEPCEDAVSRAIVLRLFATHDGKYLYDAIQRLPSVTPKVKRGEWITDPDEQWIYRCNQCGHGDDGSDGLLNFCPNCGADMRGADNV